MARAVFHVDVNNAYLSWSAVYDSCILGRKPDLRTVPSAVGGREDARCGIVLAKSEPAKRYGIVTGEPLAAARRKCPGLKVAGADFSLYEGASRALMEFLRSRSDRVETYSIDEAWMVLDGFGKLYGPPVSFARDLKDEIFRSFGFTVNIGISENRLLAKMAGELKKPDRVNTLFREEIPRKLWPLSVEKLFGVGEATAKKLRRLGIETVGQLAHADPGMLRAHLKKSGEILQGYARGEEMDPCIFAPEERRGYSNSMTAPRDVTEERFGHLLLLSLCETLGERLRADGVLAGLVGVRLKTFEFESLGRQRILCSPTDVTEEIYGASCLLFQELWDKRTPLRQLGVFTGKVERTGEGRYWQYDLSGGPQAERLLLLNRAVDRIRERYGEDSVMRAGFLNAPIRHKNGGL